MCESERKHNFSLLNKPENRYSDIPGGKTWYFVLAFTSTLCLRIYIYRAYKLDINVCEHREKERNKWGKCQYKSDKVIFILHSNSPVQELQFFFLMFHLLKRYGTRFDIHELWFLFFILFHVKSLNDFSISISFCFSTCLTYLVWHVRFIPKCMKVWGCATIIPKNKFLLLALTNILKLYKNNHTKRKIYKEKSTSMLIYT